MFPLALVEEQLGSIESWPSRVIMDMFDCEPTVLVSRRVAEFLYANGVNESDAVKLYRSSNQVFKTIAETHIYSWYFHREKGVPIKFHQHTFYYNMEREMYDVAKEGRACNTRDSCKRLWTL